MQAIGSVIQFKIGLTKIKAKPDELPAVGLPILVPDVANDDQEGPPSSGSTGSSSWLAVANAGGDVDGRGIKRRRTV